MIFLLIWDACCLTFNHETTVMRKFQLLALLDKVRGKELKYEGQVSSFNINNDFDQDNQL